MLGSMRENRCAANGDDLANATFEGVTKAVYSDKGRNCKSRQHFHPAKQRQASISYFWQFSSFYRYILMYWAGQREILRHKLGL